MNLTIDATYNATVPAFYLVLSLLVMSANGIVVAVVVKTRHLHLPTLWMITWMAACDFCMGAHIFIFSVPSAFLGRFAYQQALIGFSSCCLTFLVGQSVLNVAMVVVDRYIAVFWPLRYIHIVTMKRLMMAIAITLVLSVTRMILSALLDNDFYYNINIAVCIADFDSVEAVAASVGIPLLTLVVILFCFTRILLHVQQRRKDVTPTGRLLRPEGFMKCPIMVLFSAGLFCVSYIPFVLGIILSFLKGKENVPERFQNVIMFGVLSNSLWNVLIYTATYRPFREALTYILCRTYHRKKRLEEIRTMLSIQEC
ncbi:histamine H2 receptor-like [Haliotis cracherodii]|uniref:histamine H2 receptor-like n=1 Tax=Haliotis cracherodii TaxID=6455 RepID=UPI0039ED5DFD